MGITYLAHGAMHNDIIRVLLRYNTRPVAQRFAALCDIARDVLVIGDYLRRNGLHGKVVRLWPDYYFRTFYYNDNMGRLYRDDYVILYKNNREWGFSYNRDLADWCGTRLYSKTVMPGYEVIIHYDNRDEVTVSFWKLPYTLDRNRFIQDKNIIRVTYTRDKIMIENEYSGTYLKK